MAREKMDMAKVLAILAQPKEPLPPLENAERMRLEIPYITKNGDVDTRAVRVVWYMNASKPMPLIFVPHYEMGEDSLELRDYLAQGWAVACPDAFDNKYNGTLLDDDMVFNNAAVYALRHCVEFDQDRMALVGGSAGGYMTMMLSGQKLNLCASIANGPITNAYFQLECYFKRANELNFAALLKMKQEGDAESSGNGAKSPIEVMCSLQKLPLPFLAGLTRMFEPKKASGEPERDVAAWEAISAVGIADRYCSPVLVNHCTSDVLVPVDQITRRFTYPTPGDSLPADYDLRLPVDFPGRLGKSLEECLPPEKTRVERIIVPEQADFETVLPYDSAKQFNLNIFDDGPAEGFGTHSARMDVGRRLDVPYLQKMFEKTSKETCVLNTAMLESMLWRWLGRDAALPAHEGVNDKAYGSLAMYRQEIQEELARYQAGGGDVDAVAEKLLAENRDADLKNAWIACKSSMDQKTS